jgi:hypothetical protein
MRMGQYDDEPPAVHVWTGDEAVPEFTPLEVLEPALAGAPMPPDVVRARSKGMRTRKLETPGWNMVRGAVAVVRGDIDPDGMKAAAVYAAEMNVMLRSFVGGGGDPDVLYSVRLFRESRDFRRMASLAGAAEAESYYDPRSAELALWFGGYATPALFQRAFAHEFVHAWVDRIWNKRSPLWLMEGVAEWFSNLDWRGDILVPGQMNRHSLALLAFSQDMITLKALLELPRNAMYGINFGPYYALSWSVVDYIMTRLPHRAIQGVMEDPKSILPHEAEWRAHMRMMLGSGV